MKKILKITLLAVVLFGFTHVVFADEEIPVSESIPPPPTPTETMLIRIGDTVVYQGTVNLPAAGDITVTDDSGTNHTVNADSVLGLLYSVDQTSDAFSVSDLHYYDSFGAFYLKCITPQSGSASCDNWQYVVGGSTPSTGMDTTLLSGGETVGFYFGSAHHLVFDRMSIVAGGSFTATAQKYNYLDDTWSSFSGATIGVTVPNPNNPYNPTVVVSQTTDSGGHAVLAVPDAGSYTVGIAEDYYFPSYTMTVTVPVSNGGGGSGGGVMPFVLPAFSVPNAIAYLTSVQNTDGSFGGSDMYTDWAAIALAAGNVSGPALNNMVSYISLHNQVSTVLTDNERHAMVLLALGQNPYTFSSVDFIAPIIKSFDGTQFGDSSLVNDDIFALIPLESAGYTASDAVVTKDVAFIISKQNSDGSWGTSADMTAAAVQALKPLDSVAGVPASLEKATKYLQSIQIDDGGFGSVYSTSWVAQAMTAIDASWVKNSHDVADYFGGQQAGDGAALSTTESLENRIWATSYAIPAVLKMPWSAIMHSVQKPASQTIVANAESAKVAAISSVSTSDSSEEKPAVLPREYAKINSVATEDTSEIAAPLAAAAASGARPPMQFIFAAVLSGIVLLFAARQFFSKG